MQIFDVIARAVLVIFVAANVVEATGASGKDRHRVRTEAGAETEMRAMKKIRRGQEAVMESKTVSMDVQRRARRGTRAAHSTHMGFAVNAQTYS
jgi:hypothetical protein